MIWKTVCYMRNLCLIILKYLIHQTNKKEISTVCLRVILGDENQNVADRLTLGLISRNMRILNHIESDVNSSDDRILILFGSSHTAFFKMYYELIARTQIDRI